MEKPMDVLREFPVRKSKKQKQRFRQAVQAYAERLGYSYQEEKAVFSSRNLVMGDPEGARYLITAHYDTCARLPFPNFITPCNPGLYLLYQVGVALVVCMLVFAVSYGMARLTHSSGAAMAVSYGLILLLWLMMAGPSNKSNANDNTSGVITVLETMAALPRELRPQVCFVLFDLEEAGLIGSGAYRSKHKKATNHQLVLNADCVGDGDNILLMPSRRLRKQKDRLERWETLLPADGQKRITLQNTGFCIYPSDQAQFPLGVGIAAFCKSRWIGLYLSRIHTPRDMICDEKNVTLIRDCLLQFLRHQA